MEVVHQLNRQQEMEDCKKNHSKEDREICRILLSLRPAAASEGNKSKIFISDIQGRAIATPHPEGEHVVWLLKTTYSALQEVGIPDKENDRVGALTFRVTRWLFFTDVGAQCLLTRQFNSEDCRYAEVKDHALAILHRLDNKIKCMTDDQFKKENFYTEMETFFSKSINNISQRGRGLINELVCDFSGHTVRKTD